MLTTSALDTEITKLQEKLPQLREKYYKFAITEATNVFLPSQNDFFSYYLTKPAVMQIKRAERILNALLLIQKGLQDSTLPINKEITSCLLNVTQLTINYCPNEKGDVQYFSETDYCNYEKAFKVFNRFREENLEPKILSTAKTIGSLVLSILIGGAVMALTSGAPFIVMGIAILASLSMALIGYASIHCKPDLFKSLTKEMEKTLNSATANVARKNEQKKLGPEYDDPDYPIGYTIRDRMMKCFGGY